jgi:predicted dehydrogenase
MANNRRDFLKRTGLAGLATTLSRIIPATDRPSGHATGRVSGLTSGEAARQAPHFNMCGYAAPKLDRVRIGFIGLGNRGPAAVTRMSYIDGAVIAGLCDLRPEKVQEAQQLLIGTVQKPATYSGHEDAWKALCERSDVDVIYIATPWTLHTPMALYAMEHGKHVCIEVPSARTLEECWQLVETSERTRRHCRILENCCYDFFELLTLNMARQGLFGEIVHVEGAYIHDLLAGNFSKEKYWNMWRLRENADRNGNLYPTHGLGPICQALNINRGDKMEYLVSVSSDDFMMGKKAKELAAKDAFYAPFADKHFRGNMNTSVIRTNLGKTIMLQHDVTSPRPYSRIHLISGTKGTALKYPPEPRMAFGDEWLSEAEFKNMEAQYTLPIVKYIGEMAKKVGGHGGMDFLMDWYTIDCLRNGLPMDQDVYDTALWSSIAPLSEHSVAGGSKPVDIPDFTRGSWKTNQPIDLTLKGGGTTAVKDENKR